MISLQKEIEISLGYIITKWIQSTCYLLIRTVFSNFSVLELIDHGLINLNYALIKYGINDPQIILFSLKNWGA